MTNPFYPKNAARLRNTDVESLQKDQRTEVVLVRTIDFVLIDPQSVGKGTDDLIDTVNAKKRWKTICWRVNKYLK
jgi:hypothetical protein